MIRVALYNKDKSDDAWHFVAMDHCDEQEIEGFRHAAILFHESDLSFGFDTEYVYVVAYGAMPSSIKEMSKWMQL